MCQFATFRQLKNNVHQRLVLVAKLTSMFILFPKCMDLSSHPDRSTNYQSPTGLSWAFLLSVAAGSWGSVQISADFAERHFGSVLAQSHSLMGYFLSNSASLKMSKSAKAKITGLKFQSVTLGLFKRFYFGIGNRGNPGELIKYLASHGYSINTYLIFD